MAKQKKTVESVQRKDESKKETALSSARLYALVIFGLSFILYFNTVFNDYNLDDELVTQNHRLTSKGISAIPEIFRSPYYEDREGFKYEYRPVVLASFAIEYSLFGDSARVSHFVNVLLYSLLCVLLFIVLRDLLRQHNLLFPFIITLLFAAHPIHTEVVASIKNRDEILSLAFALLSLYSALLFVERKKVFLLLFIPVFFFAGILAKSTSITFSLLIPLSLIMFTQINIGTLLLLTTLLGIPAAFYSRLDSVFEQTVFVFVLFTSVTALYYLRHSQLLLENLKELFHKIQQLASVRLAAEETNPSPLDFSFLKSKWNFSAVALVIIAVVTICCVGIYADRIWLTVIPLFVFVLMFVFVRDELKAIFITPLSLIVLVALVKFRMTITMMETGLIVFLVMQMLSGHRLFKIIGVVNYIIYIAVALIFRDSHFFLVGLIFVGMFHKRLLPVTVLIVLVTGAIFIKRLQFIFTDAGGFNLVYLNFPLLYISIFLLWRKNLAFLSRAVVIALPLFILLHFIFTPMPIDLQLEEKIQTTYSDMSTAKAVQVTPVQALRPISFIESPINRNSPFNLKLGTAMVVLGKYLKLIFLPYPMSYYYGYAYIVPMGFFNFVPVFVSLIHLGLVIVALLYFRKIPLLSFSILFYLISLFMFSNLIIQLPGMMGDRFLLIPSIGFCVFLGYIGGVIFKQDFTDTKIKCSSLQKPLRISLGVILVCYSLLTFSRNKDWKDRITLFSHDITVVENSAQAQNLLGLHLLKESSQETDVIKQKQMREEAVVHLEKAMAIYPEFLNASFDLARAYDALNRKEEAYQQYAKTIKMDTTFAAPYFPMAIIHQNKGEFEKAFRLYERFLVTYPKQMEAYANLSYAYFQAGKYDSSIAVNKRAIAVNPSAFEPTLNIAKTFVHMNNKDSAIAYYYQALRIKPNDPNVLSSIAALQNQK